MIPDFGAHAPFIWLAYGFVSFGLIGLFVQGRWRLKSFERRSALLRDQIKAKRSPLTNADSDGEALNNGR